MLETIVGIITTLRKTSPVIFLGLSISTGIVLFCNDSFLGILGLNDFRSENKSYLGILFIVSASILLSQAIFNLWLFLIGKNDERKERKKQLKISKLKKEQLHCLTPDEKAYLVPYILNDENTQYFSLEDGIACGLATKDIIYQASEVGSFLDGWAFNIQPWAMIYLKENPHLLEGANPNPRGPNSDW